MKLPDFMQKTCSQEITRARQTNISGQLGIANPFGGKLLACFSGRMIDGIDCDYRRLDAASRNLAKRLSHKASAHFVAIGGIKRREREDVQPGWYGSLH